MSMQIRVSSLKKQFEQLFPGKWLTGNQRSGTLSTGMPEIDEGITRGIARKRITEWVGPLSSGKTTLLREAIKHWCASGLNVAYIDTEGRLFAADWTFIETETGGKLWIIRPPDKNTVATPVQTGLVSPGHPNAVLPLVSKRSIYLQEAVWTADQFLRSNGFDVVVLDLGNTNPSKGRGTGMSYQPIPTQMYARFQRSLDRSKAGLVIVRDAYDENSAWGCHARFCFDWGTSITCEQGLAGVAMITPSIKCNIQKDGLSQMMEVKLGCSVQNRLFAHPQIPDRRTSKR